MVISIYLFKSSTEARAYQGHSVLYEGVTCPLFSQTIKLQSTACLWADRPFHKSGWRSFPFPENWIMFPNMWCVPNGDILDRVWTGSHGPHSITDLESVFFTSCSGIPVLLLIGQWVIVRSSRNCIISLEAREKWVKSRFSL